MSKEYERVSHSSNNLGRRTPYNWSLFTAQFCVSVQSNAHIIMRFIIFLELAGSTKRSRSKKGLSREPPAKKSKLQFYLNGLIPFWLTQN